VRVVTVEVAEAFAAELRREIAHSVESASHAIGVNPRTLRDCINRYERGESTSEDDEAIGAVLSAARSEHILELRRKGETASSSSSGPGVAWYKWRLETQAPKEHPRRSESAVELSVAPDSALREALERAKLGGED
jgi:hypothetical protein